MRVLCTIVPQNKISLAFVGHLRFCSIEYKLNQIQIQFQYAKRLRYSQTANSQVVCKISHHIPFHCGVVESIIMDMMTADDQWTGTCV